MNHREMEPKETRIQNIRNELESLMVNLVWSTEKDFSSPNEQINTKLLQIRSYIKDLRSLDPSGYIRVTLEALGRMSPTMHKVAILTIMDEIKEELSADQSHV